MHKPTCRFAPVIRMSEMWLGKGDGKKSRGRGRATRGRGKKRLNAPISRDDDIPTDLLKKVKLKVEEEWEKEEKEAAVVASFQLVIVNFQRKG